MSKSIKFASEIDALLGRISGVKQSEVLTETTGAGGSPSDSPTATEDDGTQTPFVGDRATEFDKDLNEQYPLPVNSVPDAKLAEAINRLSRNPLSKQAAMPAAIAAKIDDKKDGKKKPVPPQFKKSEAPISQPGSAEDDQTGNMKVAPTGDDPANETQMAMNKKDDPGSAHPARIDNDSLDNRKYASMSLEKLSSLQARIGDNLVADIAVSFRVAEQQNKQAAAQAKQAQVAQTTKLAQPSQTISQETAKRAGFEYAALLDNTLTPEEADAWVTSKIAETIKTAYEDGDNVLHILKLAEEDPAQLQAILGEAGGAPPMDAGGMPPPPVESMMAPGGDAGAPASPGGDAGMDLAALQDMLAQMGLQITPIDGGDMGGGSPAPEPAEAPAEEAAEEKKEPTPESGKEAGTKTAAAAQPKAALSTKQARMTLQEIIARSKRA